MTYVALTILSAGGGCRRPRLTASDGMNPLTPAFANGERLSREMLTPAPWKLENGV